LEVVCITSIIDMLRVEKKYLQSYVEANKLSTVIRQVLPGDLHSGVDGYNVRSLYFDTTNCDDYFDKENGLENRRKIRLRIYPPNFDNIKLEMKEKNGVSQRKRTLSLTRVDAEMLIRCDYSVLLRQNSDFAIELYLLMTREIYRPQCLIEYKRQAFFVAQNDTRVTFDQRIRASEGIYDLFVHDPSIYPILPEGQVIVEVKYNHFLVSYVKDALKTLNTMETSASKYCIARQFIRY